MSTAIGVMLFVIGVGALLLSILMDRRPPARSRSAAAEPPREGADGDLVPEPGSAAPVVESPTEMPAAALPKEPEPISPSEADKAAAAEARLAKLRAELVGTSATAGSADPTTPSTPQAPAEASARTDAGRVFAAVASVGRAPEEEPRPEPPVAEAPSPELAPDAAAAPESVFAPPFQAPGDEVEVGHSHDVPLVNHSDLVTHMRREHQDLESNASTIQMRLLHERAHADPG